MSLLADNKRKQMSLYIYNQCTVVISPAIQKIQCTHARFDLNFAVYVQK